MSKPYNDEPTLHDKLDRDILVRRVGDEIARCDPPCVFGIHGEWGSGKTSFLHQLHWYLTGDCPQQTDQERQGAEVDNMIPKGKYDNLITTVWFEAWRYQHEQEPIIALLQEIRTQLPLYSKWLNERKRRSSIAFRGSLLSMEDLTKRIGFQASKYYETGERWSREHLAAALPSHTIRQHLNEALNQMLGKVKSKKRKTARLVVLIDDLDRCEGEAARRLMEGLKIYLNLPSCVFVLGMNLSIVERAIAQHIAQDKTDETQHEYAREYIDKLCSNIWHLPVLDSVCDTLGKWLPESDYKIKILALVKKHNCLPANPRKIKSFVNVLQRFFEEIESRFMATDEKRESHDAKLILLMACLYHDHHELYRMIESQPHFYYIILDWVNGGPGEHELLKRLALPVGFKETPETEHKPTPEPDEYPTFPDPVRGNVFRLRSLVKEIGVLEVSELNKYLLARPIRG